MVSPTTWRSTHGSLILSKEIWQRLCRKAFPLLSEQYLQEGSETPESWREQYFVSHFLKFQDIS